MKTHINVICRPKKKKKKNYSGVALISVFKKLLTEFKA